MCVCLSASLCASHIFIIHLSASGCLTYLHVLVIINNATVNMGMQLSSIWWFHLFQIYNQKGNDGSYSNSILNFWGNFHTVFHNGCTDLYSYQQVKKFPFYILPVFVISALIIAILRGMRLKYCDWSGVPRQLVMWSSSSSCTYWPFLCFLWEMSLQVLCPFFNLIVRFLLLSFMSSSCMLDIFSYSVGCLYFDCFFCCRSLLFWCSFTCWFLFLLLVLWCHIKKSLVSICNKEFSPYVFF